MRIDLIVLIGLLPALSAIPSPSRRSTPGLKKVPLKYTASHAKRVSTSSADRQAWLRRQALKTQKKFGHFAKLGKRTESNEE